MYEIHTEVEIDAPADVVWEVLTDFEAYPEWNGRTRVDGVAREGQRLRVSPGPDADRMPTFRPRVLRADGRELVWLGHLYVRGLFDGEHRFAVEELDDGRTRLTQSESFGGLLAGLLLRRYGPATEAGFRATNAALKGRAESLVENERPVEGAVAGGSTVARDGSRPRAGSPAVVGWRPTRARSRR